MRCNEFTELILLHMDVQLSEELSAQLKRHTLKCPNCSHELQTLQQSRAHLRDAFGICPDASRFIQRMRLRAPAYMQDIFDPQFSHSVPGHDMSSELARDLEDIDILIRRTN